MHFAKQLISQHIVTGFPEQRLTYLSDRIKTVGAHYCAVLQPRTYVLVGLVRFSDVAANPSTATRIFSDLMHPPPAQQLRDSDPIAHVIELLASDPAEIAVIRGSGEFVGLITPESFIRWLLSIAPAGKFDLAKIPVNSRWHPSPRSSPAEGTTS